MVQCACLEMAPVLELFWNHLVLGYVDSSDYTREQFWNSKQEGGKIITGVMYIQGIQTYKHINIQTNIHTYVYIR